LFDEIKKEEEAEDEDDEKEDDEDDEDDEGGVDEFGRRVREEDRRQEKRKKKGQLATYKFKVCDSLVNIGPITDFAIGESFDPASVSMAVYTTSLFSFHF
jgi:hypothetical protein